MTMPIVIFTISNQNGKLAISSSNVNLHELDHATATWLGLKSLFNAFA